MSHRSYIVRIVATNNQYQAPAVPRPESMLNVSVTVKDLNDNVPEFINIRSYYVYSTQEDECKDCNIEARDADTGEYILIYLISNIHLGKYIFSYDEIFIIYIFSS